MLLTNIPKALRTWRHLLALDGLLVGVGPFDDAFIPGTLVAGAAHGSLQAN